MAAARIQLATAKGENVVYNGTHQTSATDATPINITGWTIKVTARDRKGTVVLNKTATIVSGAAGTYSWTVTSSDSKIQPDVYDIDIQRTDSGGERLMALGTWSVTGQVLYP